MFADDLASTLGSMILLVAAYLAMFGAFELLRRSLRLTGDATRPMVHLASGLLALALPLLFHEAWPVVILAAGFVGLMLVTQRLGWLRSIHEVDRRTVGAFVYPIGVAAAFIATQGRWPAYPVTILTLAIADAAAGVIGRRFGGRGVPILGTRRTLAGSVTAFAVATAVTAGVLVTGAIGAPAVAVVALATGVLVLLVEAASPTGTDNLTIPVAIAAAFAVVFEPLVLP